METTTKAKTEGEERVIGLDAHPDSFTAAVLRGATPAAAFMERRFDKVPMSQLARWARKHLTEQDQVVLEASGNSFHVARTLRGLGFRALVLESCHLGKLKEAHANNDKISAVRIGKAYLAGTAKTVWVPDVVTQERRDWFHAHRKTTKRTTQMRNRLSSYLSDNGVRLEGGLAEDPAPQVRQAQPWSPRQAQVLEGMLLELRHAEEQRDYWRSLIAQEVLLDPLLCALVRICGIRDVVAFALGAFIGDIQRFANARKLVNYLGLSPAFDQSGEGQWSGGLHGHGRSDVRALLIEGAHALLRSKDHPLGKWGRKLMARKGSVNLAVAAVARKITVAVWYLMMGRWTSVEEIDDRLASKVGKIIGQLSTPTLQKLGKDRRQLRQETYERLKSGRTYLLDRSKSFTAQSGGRPQPVPAGATS